MNFNQTVLNPFAIIFTIIMCILIFTLKRKYIVIPVILISFFITQQQRIVLLTLDFPMLRIILICGFLRVIIRREYAQFALNKIDKIIILWSILRSIAHTILWMSPGAFIYIAGETVEILGTYFLVRLVLRDFNDYDAIVKTLIICSIPIAFFMMYEQLSGGRNLFSIFGGVPEYNLIREGRLRAQGAFSHPILAGTFGATLLPLSWGILQRNKKGLAVTGVICSFIITVASSSSGPIVTLAMGMFAVFFWRFNKYTRLARNAFFISVIGLQLVMKAPVWHLIGRIDIVGGSTGYHRFRLIDAAVNNFFGWFAFGVRNTGDWGWELSDITNQYILEGAKSGIIPLILFTVIIALCFKTIGKTRIRFPDNIKLQKYIWAFGATLFAHMISFISISYFGQIVFFYYLLIGMISCFNNIDSSTGQEITVPPAEETEIQPV